MYFQKSQVPTQVWDAYENSFSAVVKEAKQKGWKTSPGDSYFGDAGDFVLNGQYYGGSDLGHPAAVINAYLRDEYYLDFAGYQFRTGKGYWQYVWNPAEKRWIQLCPAAYSSHGEQIRDLKTRWKEDYASVMEAKSTPRATA